MWDKRKKIKSIEEERWDRLVANQSKPSKKKRRSQFEKELVLVRPAAYRETKVERLDTRAHHTYKKRTARYDNGELQLRELKAQMELDRKKKQVAPAYSKGAYQYISDETDLSDLGRKK